MNRSLEYGLYLLVFLLPLQTVWIVQEALIGPEGAVGLWHYGTLKIYALEFLIVALALLAGGYRIFHRACRYIDTGGKVSRLAMGAAACVLFAGLSIFWSDNRIVALFAWGRILEGVFLFFLFRTIPLRFSWFVSAWIAAAVIQSTLGMWQFGMQEVFANTFLGIATHDPATLGTSVVEAGDRRWLRAYGGFPHPNILGAYLAVSIIVCATALRRAKEKWQWLILLAASQILLIALLLTFSRGAWLALCAAGLLAVLLSAARFLKTIIPGQVNILTCGISPLMMMGIVSIVTVAVFSAYFSEEMAARIGFAQSRLEAQSIGERISSVERALPLMKERWIAGTGIGNFTNTLFRYEENQGIAQPWYSYQPIHNAFLMIFAELGVLGIILLFFILFLFFRDVPSTLYPLPSTLIILSLFDHFLWTLPFGIFLASITLGATLGAVAIHRTNSMVR